MNHKINNDFSEGEKNKPYAWVASVLASEFELLVKLEFCYQNSSSNPGYCAIKSAPCYQAWKVALALGFLPAMCQTRENAVPAARLQLGFDLAVGIFWRSDLLDGRSLFLPLCHFAFQINSSILKTNKIHTHIHKTKH